MLDSRPFASALGACLLGAFLIRRELWRALICLFPQSVRVEVDTPDPDVQVPAPLEATWEALQKLGFLPLGSHVEHPFAVAPTVHYDAVHAGHHVFASVSCARFEQPRLVLFTPTDGGGVVTANYRRPAREVSGHYLSGGLEGASADRLVNAHLRRLAGVGAPKASWTLEGRVEAARAWYRGAGKVELRQQHVVGLLWTAGGLGMVGAALAFFLRTLIEETP